MSLPSGSDIPQIPRLHPPTCRQHMISFIQNHIADALGANPTFHANQLQPRETKNEKKKNRENHDVQYPPWN